MKSDTALLLGGLAVGVILVILLAVVLARRGAARQAPHDPWRRARRRGDAVRMAEPETGSGVAMPPPERSTPEIPPAASRRPDAEAPRPEEPGAVTPRIDTPVSAADRCFALLQDCRHAEAVVAGLSALQAGDETPAGVVKLWGVVGLAKQALHDPEGARTAFEEAIARAAAEDRPTWERHLAALALQAGRAERARADAGGGVEVGEPVVAARSAIAWLECGAAAAPNDPTIQEVLAAARSALWDTYDQTVGVLVRRQRFATARRLLGEVLADPALPAARQPGLRTHLATVNSGEVGQLTADAIRAVQEDRHDEVAASLERAETLLRSLGPEDLPAGRRQEVLQRVWWGYTTVGTRRIEAGAFEDAVDPLCRALGVESVAAERLAESRSALRRALDGLVETTGQAVGRLLAHHDRPGAVALAERVRTLVQSALQHGFPADDARAVRERAERLRAEAGRGA